MGMVPISAAFRLGIENSVNPCSMTALVVFILFISWVGSDVKRSLTAGFCFALIFFLINILLTLAVFDKWLNRPQVMQGIKIIYLIISLAFAWLAALNIIDWGRLKQGLPATQCAIRTPVFIKNFQNSDLSRKPLSYPKLIFLSIILSVVFALLGSIWPPSYIMFIVFCSLLAKGNFTASFLSIAIYSFGCTSLLIAIWILLTFIVRKGPVLLSINGLIQLKIVSVAVFLSTAMGLMFLFTK